MDIQKYESLSGFTVAQSDQNYVKAVIKRTRSTLEALLGYTLYKPSVNSNEYDEAGKTSNQCGDVTGDLQAADEVVTAYRLYRFNPDDKFLAVDPFTKLNKVKLVFIKSGDTPNGVTLKTFDADEARVQMKNGFAKYIEICKDCIDACNCDCDDCVQLAVDADWLYDACLPDELQYIWADMVTYYSDPKLGIKSETLDTHRYEVFSNDAPESISDNKKTLQKYAGPNGTLYQVITI